VLRFSYSRARDGERWVLSGQLSRPWIDALRSIWRCFRYRNPRGRVVVGLKEVTAVDTVGAQLLAELKRVGVDFTENELKENPVAKDGDVCAAQSGDARRAEERQKP
jgi:ABC-type transporter Mla MlaB component